MEQMIADSKQKKVCLINSVYRQGSTGRLVADLTSFLSDHGLDARVFYGRKNKQIKDDEKSRCFSSPLSVKSHVLLSRFFDRSGFYSFHSTRRLIRILEKWRPDVVVLNNIHGYYLHLPLFLGYLAKSAVPVIMVFHDCWNFTGHCAYFDYSGCDKWKTSCSHCPNKSEYPKSLFLDQSKKNFLQKRELFSRIKHLDIISPSGWLGKLIEESFFKERHVEIIHNGIDLDVFKKIDSGIRQKIGLASEKMILCASYLFDKRKGLGDILELSKMVGPDETIVMVGGIPSGIKLPSNIKYIERTNNAEDLVSLYSTADVFFNPTYEDNYPTVNIEALACGCPVICYKSGGACESIDPNFAIEKGHIAEAYGLMKSLFSGVASYRFPKREALSKTTAYDAYLALIHKILAAR